MILKEQESEGKHELVSPDASRLSRQAVGLAEILRSENLDEAARQSAQRLLVAISGRQRNGSAS